MNSGLRNQEKIDRRVARGRRSGAAIVKPMLDFAQVSILRPQAPDIAVTVGVSRIGFSHFRGCERFRAASIAVLLSRRRESGGRPRLRPPLESLAPFSNADSLTKYRSGNTSPWSYLVSTRIGKCRTL